MYLNYNIVYIHELFNEYKKKLFINVNKESMLFNVSHIRGLKLSFTHFNLGKLNL